MDDMLSTIERISQIVIVVLAVFSGLAFLLNITWLGVILGLIASLNAVVLLFLPRLWKL